MISREWTAARARQTLVAPAAIAVPPQPRQVRSPAYRSAQTTVQVLTAIASHPPEPNHMPTRYPLGVMPGSIVIQPGLEIPESDLNWSYSRSGGPGGQHVNTTDTRARVHFALTTSDALTGPVKRRLREQNPSWVNSEGDLVISSGESRSRLRNVEIVEERLADAVRAALKPPKRRKKTRPSRAAKKRRLESKKRRGQLKASRKRPRRDD